jgi:hypothetical protein
MTARKWLADNGYNDILKLIDRVEALWKAKGVTTRRNWWEVLAGDRHGQPRTVEGFQFPVLAAAQEHENKPPTKNAVRRRASEKPPEKDFRGQWHRTASAKARAHRTRRRLTERSER